MINKLLFIYSFLGIFINIISKWYSIPNDYCIKNTFPYIYYINTVYLAILMIPQIQVNIKLF